MRFEPLGDRLLIKVVEPDENDDGNMIIIPDSAKERPTQGEVLEVGPDVEKIKVGYTVLYSKYAGTEINLKQDEETYIPRADDILGLLV